VPQTLLKAGLENTNFVAQLNSAACRSAAPRFVEDTLPNGEATVRAVVSTACIATFILALTPSANAEQGKIASPAGLDVIVWKRASAQKVLALLGAKTLDVSQFLPLVACEVRSGTAAAILSRSSIFYNVQILSGPQKRCRGSVAKKMFVRG
jgi:hypothetical protein